MTWSEAVKKISIWCLSKVEYTGKVSIFLPLPLHPSALSLAGVGKCLLLTRGSTPLAKTRRTKIYTASSLGQELFISCIPYSMSHREALTWLRLSWVINKSVLIIASSSHLGMRKWFITPICWIIHSSGAKMAWNMSSEDLEVFSMIGILFSY